MRLVVALGSNVGDRIGMLREATRRLAEIARVVSGSRVYETAPVGPPQPDYLNAAVLIETEMSLVDVLAELHRIERSMGRVRTEKNRWRERTIDLDILWSDGPPFRSADLEVPHPRLHERAFAILPLLDVAPEAPYTPPPSDGSSPPPHPTSLSLF